MSKKLIRKGLAIGASASLALTALVGFAAPANANETLRLAPSAGTSYNVLTTSDFKLLSGFQGNESSQAAGTLKYRVTNTLGALVNYATQTNATAAANSVPKNYGTAVNATDGTVANHYAGTDVVVLPVSPAIAVENSLTVALASHDRNYTITVQAWLDLDGDNSINGEPVSPIRTITFYDEANVSGTATLTAPVLGGASLSATVVLSPEMNYQQLDANDVTVRFLKDSVSITSFTNEAVGVDAEVDTLATAIAEAANTTTANPTAVAWVSADSAFKATFTPTNTVADAVGTNPGVNNPLVVAASAVYAAQLRMFNGTTYVDKGSASLGSTAPGTVTTVGALTVAKQSFYLAAGDKVRAGAGNVNVRSTITVTAPQVLAGQTVTFRIAESNATSLDAAATVTAGGKTLTNTRSSGAAEFIDVDVVTDALGRANLAISYTGIKNANAFVVTPSAKGASATVSGAAKTFTGDDSVATALVDIDAVGAAPKRAITVGGSASVNYVLVDQFGQTPDGTFQLVMTESSSQANFANNVAVSSGRATYTVVDNSASANDYNLVATVQKRNAVSGAWEAIGGGLSRTSNLIVGAIVAPIATTVAPAATTALPRTLDDYVAGNTDVEQSSVVRPTGGFTTGTTFSGLMTGANGGPAKGAQVTLSGAGLMFSAGNTYKTGSITVLTNELGQLGNVIVYSNLAGKRTVTLTSGSVSKSYELTFEAAGADDGTAINLSAPKSIKSGRTLVITGKIVDDWGNPVPAAASTDISVSYSGPGYVFTSTVTTTDANGAFSVRVLLGSNETGVGSVTATYDPTGSLTVADTQGDRISATSATWVGPIANAKAGAAKGRVIVEAYRAKGKTVNVFVGSTRVASFVADKANFSAVVRGVKSGTRNVSVRLSGPGEDFRGAITVK